MIAKIKIIGSVWERFILLIYLVIFWNAETFGQNSKCNCTLTGKVVQQYNKNTVIGATLYLKGTNNFTITDKDGIYTLKGICEGNYTLVCQLIGFHVVEIPVKLRLEHIENILLNEEDTHLQEVIVTGQKLDDFMQSSSRLSKEDLEKTRGQNLGEALKSIVGVTSLQTGGNISKPVIHGMHSNRVLLLNNGTRQEGQQWGAEHAPEIDPFIAKNIQVIKGAAGVQYGADAIAGVILVEPDALPDTSIINGEINSVAFSNGLQLVNSGILEGGIKSIKGFAWRIQGTIKKGGDLKTAEYYLGNTAIQEKNYSFTVGYKTVNWTNELFFSKFATQIGIFSGSHIGNVTDLQKAINSTQPLDIYTPVKPSRTIGRPSQDVSHNLLKLKSKYLFKNKNGLSISMAYQNNFRLEYDALRAGKNINTLRFFLDTYSTDINYSIPNFGKETNAIFGLSFQRQENLSSGSEVFTPFLKSTLIPNFKNNTFGLFGIGRYNKAKWELESGIRFDIRNLVVYRPVLNYSTNIFENKTNNKNLSGTIGACYLANSFLHIKLLMATAWRPPNVNELFSDGVHHGAATFEKGDSTLKAEKAYNLSTEFSFQKAGWKFDLSLYHNYIADFIYLNPRDPNTPNGYVLTVRGGFPAFDYKQINAKFSGIDFLFSIPYSNALNLSGKYASVWAKNTKNNTYLVNIPANRFEHTLNYKNYKHNINASISLLWVMHQGRTEINSDFATPPPSYKLISTQIMKVFTIKNIKIDVGFSINNLLNTRYREYLNRFRYFADDQGRNISMRLKLAF